MTNEHDPNEPNNPQGNAYQGETVFTPVTNNPDGQPGPLKHSGLGIASFVLAIISILAFLLSIIMIFAAASNVAHLSPTEIESELMAGGGEEFAAVLGGGLLIMLAIGISIIGLILGIIGLVIKNRKKIFGILGVVLNGLIVLGIVFLMVIGLALGG